MARRLLRDKLIPLSKITESIYYIKGSEREYISKSGNIYCLYENNLYLKRTMNINKANGYVYIGINMLDGKRKTFRVHKLVAQQFIENPDNLPIVGHKNNIKHDNRVENLYWTTHSENTKKAYDDGLACNAKEAEDSQSTPVIAYKNGEYLEEFGSLKECSRELNIPIQTIIRRCNKEIKTSYRKYTEYDFSYKYVL